MKSYLPTNLSCAGWCIAIVLTPLCFFLYYNVFYGMISDVYQRRLWSSSQFSNNEEKLYVRVSVPRNVSDFVDGEIRIQGWNRSLDNKELNMVVKADIYDNNFPDIIEREKCKPVQVNQPFVYISAESSSDQKKNHSVGTSSFTLSIPAYGSSNVSLWIIIQPNTHMQEKSCVVLQFFSVISKQTEKHPEDCESGIDIWVCPIKFDDLPSGKFVVQIDQRNTLVQSFYSILLLPPWSNLVLVSLVLFGIWVVEQPILILIKGLRWYFDKVTGGKKNE